MTGNDYTTAFTVHETPEAVYVAINDVRGWWSEEIDGSTDRLGAEFDYSFRGDVHRCRIRITELAPGRKVAWHVVENAFSFTEDRAEWTGTDIVFDISRKGDLTEVRMTHFGLVPEYECYDICSDGWRTYINGSLRDLISTGKGRPNLGEPMNESERALVS